MPRLYKKEKLCSATAIDMLFARNGDCQSSLSYPLRCVWRIDMKRRSDAPIQFLISIPKKRIRHAVDRVKMRRRVREAYRLCRDSYPIPDGVRVDVAFIYVDKALMPYSSIERAMHTLLARLSHNLAEHKPLADETCHQNHI